MLKGKHAFKIVLFLILLGFLFTMSGSVFQPVWESWNNYDTTRGFYLEPENTVDAVFLGSSITVNSFSPMELYEKYGFCTYNLGMEQQPMMASYYWLKEAYRLHPRSLKVVFLDPSSLRREQSTSYYQKALDGIMHIPTKLEAFSEYSGNLNKTLEYSIPLLEYHDRWDSMNQTDEEKLTYDPDLYTRGYNFTIEKYIDSKDDYRDIGVPRTVYDRDTAPATLDDEALKYFDRIVDFCNEKNLKLIVLSIPRLSGWNAGRHNAVKILAEKHGVEYYDLNTEDSLKKMNFVVGYDHKDMHLNYYGAAKFTDWLGQFIIDKGLDQLFIPHDDVRFMEKELVGYDKYIKTGISLHAQDNISDYLSQARDIASCYIFLSVKDDASHSLTQEQREFFKSAGLEKLSLIDYRDSYIGVIKNGTVQIELTDEDIDSEECLEFSPGKDIEIKSGGYNRGNLSSIIINGQEYSENKLGLNIVVYDYKEEKVIDASRFNTYSSSKRIGDISAAYQQMLSDGTEWYDMPDSVKKLYLYNRKYDNQVINDYWSIYGDESLLFAYLAPYIREEGYMVYISVRDDAANFLTSEVRQAFEGIGLTELSRLEYRDSYVGIIDDGQVFLEQRNHEAEPLVVEQMNYSIVSAGFESGNRSSIIINGGEYSGNKTGINIAVYDKQLQKVVSKYTFNTYKTTPSLQQELEVND